MKILIIGHPGSGKTYLADLLNSKTGIENVDIDGLFDTKPYRVLSKRLYKKALEPLLEGKNDYIIDGYHVSLMPDRIWVDTDIIIYLNLPASELKKNILTRYKQKKSAKEFSHWQSVRMNNLKNYAQIKFQDKALQRDIERIMQLKKDVSRYYELKTRDEIKNFVDTY